SSGACISPNGAALAQRATKANHQMRTRVGSWRTVAAVPPSTPAAMPAVKPHTITGPAAGTASRLAGTDATGRRPKAVSSKGATPTCAAIVIASGPTTNDGPGTAATILGASTTMAADAATDNWKPTLRTRNGSATRSNVTASASSRIVDVVR